MQKQILYLLFFVTIFLSLTKQALAQESIKNFDVTTTAQKNGILKIEENIQYDFGNLEKHGIYRNIPLVSKVGDLFRVIKINFTEINRDGAKEKFNIDKTSKETKIKIGDPDKTISGMHNYIIKYDVENGIGSNFEDHDEIYWNVTGDQWIVPIDNVSQVIKTDFGVLPDKTICFTGSFGSKNNNCKVESINRLKKVTTTKKLDISEGLTTVTSFPVNTFPKSLLQKEEPFLDPDFITFLKILIPIYLILNLLIAPYLIYWYLKYKRKNRFGKISVNFDLPEYPKGKRITPAEAGTIDNTKLDKDDIVATIFDLAIGKYIKIQQVTEKKLLGLASKDNYQLIKLKEFDDLNPFEQKLTKSIFGEEKNVAINDTKLTYYEFNDLEDLNFKSLVDRNFYSKNPKTQMQSLFTLGIILTLTLNLILGPIILFLSRKLNGRTKLGDEIDWKTDGLKLFLKNMSREYKFQAENFYFVEKMIPYAMALGYIDEYMKQLKILKPDYRPTWYSGHSGFYNFYPGFSSSMSSNVTTSAPSSSSGFSGGSSGGGGGGGGGGSW